MIAPPPVLISMGVIEKGTYWIVRKALYGLKEAPKLWEKFRDETLKYLEFEVDGVKYGLKKTQVHGSIWGIYRVDTKVKRHTVEEISEAIVPILPELRGAPIATMGIYVDDFLYAGPRKFLMAFHAALSLEVKIGKPDILGGKL